MINITNFAVLNIENAIRGMRNPFNSWEKSDSKLVNGVFTFGENDLKLAQTLCKAGSDHRKYMRQIIVSCDILAPLYWWKEFDTYKVSTVTNSTSTMHTIHKKKIKISDFSCDSLDSNSIKVFENYINKIEELRNQYAANRDKKIWEQIIEMLPSSYNQLRTCTFNFETMFNMVNARSNHRLNEWMILCDYFMEVEYFKDILECKKVTK